MEAKVMFLLVVAALASADHMNSNDDLEGASSYAVKNVMPYPYKSVEKAKYTPISYDDAGSAFILAPVEEAKTISVKGYFLSSIWSATTFIIHNIVAIGLGIIGAVGLCKLTPVCQVLSDKFHNVEYLRSEMRSFMTPEKIATASEFVHKAIEKFSKAQ